MAEGTRGDPHELIHDALADRYQLEDELARGGMARVFAARDRKHDRRVAVKVIDPELTRGEGAQRFEREIAITSKLQHPHIVPLIDSGAVGELLYYITPFVPGASLQERLEQEGSLSVQESVRVARDVAEALDYAHRAGVVHRDIKPGNILISDGQAIVTDFGIARAVQGGPEHKLTPTGVVVGTLLYMSPEQLGERREIDGRADIYSLGCVLYQMLTGRPPFTGEAQEVIRQVLFGKPRSIREQRDDVPAHVEAAVLKAMAKEPDKRFSSAAEFAAALESARVSGAGAPAWQRSSFVGPAIAAVVVLAVGLGLAGLCAG
jgi:serine/threonine-protein kinase